MPQPSPPSTSEYLEEVAGGIRSAVQALDLHESDLGLLPCVSDDPHNLRMSTLGRLDDTLENWQRLLSTTADQVRSSQEELDALGVDLCRALEVFTTARKHLQGSADEAGGSPPA